MSNKAKTEKGRRVLSAPGKPKIGSRAYKQWLAFKRFHGLQIKGGRSPVYTPRMAEAARKLVELGANDFEISQVLGVDPSTIVAWRTKHPEFAEALKFRDENGTFADDRVKRSLLHKATGYSYHSEKIFYDKETGVTRVPTIEHVPPSDTAMIFYLKNRDPDRWNDRRQVDVNADVRVVPAIKPGMSNLEAMNLFRAVLDGAVIEDEDEAPPVTIEGIFKRE
jgi:hypothetical protein